MKTTGNIKTKDLATRIKCHFRTIQCWRRENVKLPETEQEYIEYLSQNRVKLQEISSKIELSIVASNNIDISPDILYTAEEVAKMLQCTEMLLFTWRQRGQNLTYYRLQNLIRYKGEDIIKLIDYMLKIQNLKQTFC